MLNGPSSRGGGKELETIGGREGPRMMKEGGKLDGGVKRRGEYTMAKIAVVEDAKGEEHRVVVSSLLRFRGREGRERSVSWSSQSSCGSRRASRISATSWR